MTYSLDYLDDAIYDISRKYEIENLISIDKHYNDNGYWVRMANLSFFGKIRDEHNYHFLYEIQSLSSQIHFGLTLCILFKDRISTKRGHPNIYNHRFTFAIESTIHNIYGYWNRVALVLNTYLKKPRKKGSVYFKVVVNQLSQDYPELGKNENYNWITQVMNSIEELDRNEFAHNNSLIMQNFLGLEKGKRDVDYLLSFPEKLLVHNKFIVDDIYNLVELLETLEETV